MYVCMCVCMCVCVYVRVCVCVYVCECVEARKDEIGFVRRQILLKGGKTTVKVLERLSSVCLKKEKVLEEWRVSCLFHPFSLPHFFLTDINAPPRSPYFFPSLICSPSLSSKMKMMIEIFSPRTPRLLFTLPSVSLSLTSSVLVPYGLPEIREP